MTLGTVRHFQLMAFIHYKLASFLSIGLGVFKLIGPALFPRNEVSRLAAQYALDTLIFNLFSKEYANVMTGNAVLTVLRRM